MNIQKAAPLISVVSLSYNRRRNVIELMEALQVQDYSNFEIILVDNNSSDGTAEAVESNFPEVRIIRCFQNFGMVAYNFGFANAKGDIILVIDDDGLPGSVSWISQIANCFQSNERLGAIACTIRMRDTGKIARDNPQHLPEGDVKEGLKAASYNGTGAGLRKEALEEVGFYPFPFFRSWLEFHLCTRLVDHGWEVRYFPDIEVWHSRPSGATRRFMTYYGLRNYFWYVWTLYPWPEVFRETTRYFGFCLKLILKAQLSPMLLSRALFDMCIGWPKISSERHPVSRKTVNYLHRLRKCKNDYGFSPTYRAYSQFPRLSESQQMTGVVEPDRVET